MDSRDKISSIKYYFEEEPKELQRLKTMFSIIRRQSVGFQGATLCTKTLTELRTAVEGVIGHVFPGEENRVAVIAEGSAVRIKLPGWIEQKVEFYGLSLAKLL